MKTLLEKIEEYADSIDDDINTINNFEINCCDERELEVLQNVFDVLSRIIGEYKK